MPARTNTTKRKRAKPPGLAFNVFAEFDQQDAETIALGSNPKFWEMIQASRKKPGVFTLDEISERHGLTRRKRR